MGDEAKIFIRGLTGDTTEEMLMGYFGRYGEVLDAKISRNRITKQSRKYGFVLFAEQATLDRVLPVEHVIRGRKGFLEAFGNLHVAYFNLQSIFGACSKSSLPRGVACLCSI
ncbi:uncharacterized protein A4U43_C07F20120 [Asparagus officinalis]|uniref:RRM domain-containing protein n=1 Tax=Asparagus officinalis TaxID=4686 RepID=A0A5P1EDK6_ASPOF|nr:uncharacterized protein A4U43_C07F20120 [Asparagus officinalis]